MPFPSFTVRNRHQVPDTRLLSCQTGVSTPSRRPGWFVLLRPDGQMADMFLTSQNLYLKDGTLIPQGTSSHQIVDTNGNVITETPSSVTDSIGRIINVAATPASLVFTYPDPSHSGQTATVTLNFTTITANCVNGGGQPTGASGTYVMPSSIVLPNGLSYTLQYNSCGLIQKVTYPTGGFTRYDYTVMSFLNVNPNAQGAYTAVPTNEVAHKYACPAAASGNSCPYKNRSPRILPWLTVQRTTLRTQFSIIWATPRCTSLLRPTRRLFPAFRRWKRSARFRTVRASS